MNREILFRGKRLDNDEWAEGFYVHIPCGRFLCDEYMIQTVEDDGRIGHLHNVYEYTVGQFTGLTDKNGKRIFEGDMVVSYSLFGHEDGCGIVNWNNLFSAWHIGERTFYGTSIASYEIIGNIHDNPELLEANHAK